MKYKDIINPTELLEFMDNNITYGFVDDNNKIYSSKNYNEFQEGCRTKWKLSSPERLLDKKYGHCFDQVELERDWFSKNNYKFKTFFGIFELDYENPYFTHTFLIYEDNNMFYTFEHADQNNRGIREYSSYENAINSQIKNLIKSNREYNNLKDEELSSLHIYEYDKLEYGISMYEFVDRIVNNKKNMVK